MKLWYSSQCALLDEIDANIVGSDPLQQAILKVPITKIFPGTMGRDRTEASLDLNSMYVHKSQERACLSLHIVSYW